MYLCQAKLLETILLPFLACSWPLATCRAWLFSLVPSKLPCACGVYAGDWRTALLLPIAVAVAVAFRSDIRKSSWSDWSTGLLRTACTLALSMRNCWTHVDGIARAASCPQFVLPCTCLFPHPLLWGHNRFHVKVNKRTAYEELFQTRYKREVVPFAETVSIDASAEVADIKRSMRSWTEACG